MNIFIDECLSPINADKINNLLGPNYNASHVRKGALILGASDIDVLNFALSTNSVIVTRDKGFIQKVKNNNGPGLILIENDKLSRNEQYWAIFTGICYANQNNINFTSDHVKVISVPVIINNKISHFVNNAIKI